jgi:hypothetical protein
LHPREAPSRVFWVAGLTAAAPGCAGIDQSGERVGAAAVDLVVEQLHANEFGRPPNPKTVLIEGRWVPGKTAPGPGHAAVKAH